MKLSGLTESELVDAFKKKIRSILELAVPVWYGGLTQLQSNKIERIQKTAIAAILGQKYSTYEHALTSLNLKSLSDRRTQICSKFIEKNMKSEYPLLSKVQKMHNTRSNAELVEEVSCRTQAFFDSSISFLARLYNKNLKLKSK